MEFYKKNGFVSLRKDEEENVALIKNYGGSIAVVTFNEDGKQTGYKLLSTDHFVKILQMKSIQDI